MRQEAGARNAVAGALGRTADTQSRDKRGTGQTVSLPVYQNDVLHALAETGGLPGLDAENVIYVIRASRRHDQPLPSLPVPVAISFVSSETITAEASKVLILLRVTSWALRAKNFA